MKRSVLNAACAAFCVCATAAQAEDSALHLKQTIPIAGVEGRIDHLALDAATERLFVCALGNNTVELIDLQKGARVKTITGLGAPQGLAYVPELNRLFVANDKGGLCNIYDGRSLALNGQIDFKDDADNARYDSATKRIYVGFGNGGIGIINAVDGKLVREIKVDGHPEAFELEKRGSRIFVNIPTARQVAVIDREKGAVTATWKTGAAVANFPMAFDEANHRLFIGCRTPSKLVVLNTDSGAVITDVSISGDPDDVFYDTKRRRIYAICGAGNIDVVEQVDANTYRLGAKVPTADGARTGLFVPELNSLFVAVPHRGSQPAEIRRYSVE